MRHLLSGSSPVHRLGAALLALPVLALAGCDDSELPTGGDPELDAEVAVALSVVAPDGMAVSDGLVVTGSNGVLRIDRLDFLVEEVELEGTRGTEDFEKGPLFVELPMSGALSPIVSSDVPPGRYDELEFEIDDLDDDDEFLAEVREFHADWPDDASMRIEGSFEPADGSETRTFVVYLEAEVEIELELDPALVVEEEDTETLLVTLSPGLWFMTGTGEVIDLSAWNYIDGDDLVELEIEIEDGFLSVEWDD